MIRAVFAVVGPIASGKGTVIKILQEHGYIPFSTSDRIREEIKSRNQEITRENLTKTSNELRTNFGNDILAKRTGDLVDKSDAEKVVIDSIRNPDEIKFFQQKYGIKVIAITAPQEKRYEMFMARGANNAGIENFDQFKTLDDKELNGTLGEHAQRVADCIKMADVTIENNGTVEDLKQKVENYISSVK